MIRTTKAKLLAELKEMQEKYRMISEESEDVIFSASLGGPFREINPAGVRLFRYDSPKELLRADLAHDLCLNPEDRSALEMELVRKGHVKDVELAMKRKDGDRIIVRASAIAIRDETGNVVAYRGILKDITEKRNLEQQLLQAQKMEAIGLMAGGVAHDFNNLLTVILGNVQLGLAGIEPSHSHYDILTRIQEEGKKASAITRRLLAFSRGQALQRKVIRLVEQMDNLTTMLSRLIGEDIELRIDFRPELGCVYLDEAALDQVLMNLAVNAREAMPRGGVLTIQAQNVYLDSCFCDRYPFVKPGHYVQLSIVDTGLGMEESVLQRVFEPFFSTKDGGTGLGLAVVYGVVKQHKGYVLASSQVGKGSRFDIYLPLHLKPAREDRPAPQKPVRGGTETLLMAEDEPEIRNLFKAYLEKLGYSVLLAEDGEEALKVFSAHQNRIDLVILDAIMPKLSGPRVYQEMRTVRPKLPCILLTGYGKEMIKKYAEEGLDVPVLQKPVTFEELGGKIRELLAIP